MAEKPLFLGGESCGVSAESCGLSAESCGLSAERKNCNLLVISSLQRFFFL